MFIRIMQKYTYSIIFIIYLFSYVITFRFGDVEIYIIIHL